VEESIIQNVIDRRRRHLHIPAFSHRRILGIFTVTTIRMIVKINHQLAIVSRFWNASASGDCVIDKSSIKLPVKFIVK